MLRRPLALSLALTALLAAGAGAQDRSADREKPVTLWISSSGTYHLGEPTSAAIPERQLQTQLEAALEDAGDLRDLDLRVYRGELAYYVSVAQNAACRAGFDRVRATGNLPEGSTDLTSPGVWHKVMVLGPTCGPVAGRRELPMAR